MITPGTPPPSKESQFCRNLEGPVAACSVCLLVLGVHFVILFISCFQQLYLLCSCCLVAKQFSHV
jgi:hypothetical protein